LGVVLTWLRRFVWVGRCSGVWVWGGACPGCGVPAGCPGLVWLSWGRLWAFKIVVWEGKGLESGIILPK
jgi:hypothetical protein